MARKRVSYLEKQWVMDQNRVPLNPGFSSNLVLASDPDGTLNTEARLLRVMVSCRWGFEDLDCQNPLLIGIGLCRADNNISTSMNPTLNSSANKRWLYRHHMVGPTTVTNFKYTGDLHVLDPSYPQHFDWQVHGGKGVTLNKDESFVLAFSAVGNYLNAVFTYNVLS